MAVTQYIGARYVPMFADPVEWNDTRTYEPLTVVIHEGNSFTSRQFVPVGIDIDNDNFWVETGNYNAQVESYRQEVRTFDGRITQNANDINSLESDVEDIESDITSLETADNNLQTQIDTVNGKIGSGFSTSSTVRNQIDALQTEIQSLDTAVSPFDYFRNHNVVIIGDSYAYGTGCSDHGAGDSKRWSSILCDRLNATERNFAVGSTGFCDPGSSGQNAPFKTQVITAANAMNQTERNNTHLVVIAGGVNDYNEGATYGAAAMQSGANQAAVNARTYFPNAVILVVPMLFKGHDANPRLLNFENAIINGVGGLDSVRNTVYIRGAWTWNWGIASHFANDQLHPNDLGHKTIASQIYTHILGGSAYENRLEGISWDSGFSSSVTDGGYLQFYNGLVQSMGTIVTGEIAANTTQKIGTVDSACVPLVNVSTLLMQGNEQAGIAMITTSGNLYLRTTKSASNWYIGPFSYLPKGNL